VHGREINLPDAQARLVVFVVLGHPRPLHIEELGDRLWPDASLPQVRVRTNSLLYRLRRSLGTTAEDLIDRRGDLVRLNPGACAVDLFELWARVAAGGPGAGTALAAVRSNLCPAHDPYDEYLIDARRQFAAEWTAQARNAVRRHLATPDKLAAAARALEVDLEELVPLDRHR
jgi:DNA-binding SARP family transcriptional activator